MILPTQPKNHIILWEKLKITWKKNPSELQKLNPDFSEEGKKERQLGMWVFYAIEIMYWNTWLF